MEIGAAFEDDYFEEPREKKFQKSSHFEPKICNLQWFMESELKEDDGCKLDTVKHQADFYYYSKNYSKAAEAYEKCLELVSPLNSTWRREFMENIARSLLHMGEAEKALTWSLKLHACSINSDQRVVSMNLLATVCHELGKYKEELEALHCCLEAHKCCPEFWMRLGLCYAGLFRINLPSCTINSSQEEQESCCAFNSKVPSNNLTLQEENSHRLPIDTTTHCAVASTSSSNISGTVEAELSCGKELVSDGDTVKCEICTLGIQIVSTCLIQTRVLIDTGGNKLHGSERDRRFNDTINASLRHMEVHQSFIDEASKVLGPEFLAGLQDSACSNSLSRSAVNQVENDV